MYRIEINGREYTVDTQELARVRERGLAYRFVLTEA